LIEYQNNYFLSEIQISDT